MLGVTTRSSPHETDARLTIADRIVNRLSRVTSSGRFVPEIDGLRFFAIAGVIFAHIAGLVALHPTYTGSGIDKGLLYHLLGRGTDGVRLFFSISGFILSLPFAESYLLGKSRPKIAKYYTRRVTRLEPPYIVCLIVGLIGVSLYGSHFYTEVPHFFASMVYAHALIYHEPSTLGGILWSLEIEVQFYILAPLLAQMFRIRNASLRRAALVLAIASGMIMQWRLVPTFDSFYRLTILGNLYYFLVGFLAAEIYLARWTRSERKNYLWDLVVLSAVLLDGLLSYYAYQWHWFFFPAAVLIAYSASFCGVISSRIVRNRWLVVTGGMCYTIYLYHMITMRPIWVFLSSRLVVMHTYALDYLLQLLILCPILLAATSLLFITFEKPFMQRDWPARWKTVVSSFLRDSWGCASGRSPKR